MRENKEKGMVLLQTTVHEDVHRWLMAKAVQDGSTLASLVRGLVHKAYEVAPDLPGQRFVRRKLRGPKAKAKARKAKSAQLALPGTDRKGHKKAAKKKAAKKAVSKRRRTVTQRRGLNHIEPEAAQ